MRNGAAVAAAAAPWDAVEPHEQLFVLITGANSGVGLGLGQRLIDEFLATRSLSSHLVLMPTTRSDDKSLETVRALRDYAARAAQISPIMRARYASAALSPSNSYSNGSLADGSKPELPTDDADAAPAADEEDDGYRWQDVASRVHVLSLVVDLCDLRAVYLLADRLRHATVSNPPGLDDEYLTDVRIPRLDSVIFNAAYGGWSGFRLFDAIYSILFNGIVHAVTWPEFKKALPTRILNEQPRYNYPPKPLLGEVFCACIFGHYVLAHRLMPLLSRRSAREQPGRIIWSSSVEAVRSSFNFDDMQGFQRAEPYESAKRLTDIISLTADLPSVKPYSDAFLRIDGDPGAAAALPARPRVYLSHPGVVASTLFPVPWFLFWAYRLALVLSRWAGSAWHAVDGYKGAKSASWLALQPQAALDAAAAERVKWGSSVDHRLDVRAKKTEVEGWGWEGRVEDAAALRAEEGAEGVFRKVVGRHRDVVDATDESIAQFEEVGAQVWKRLEDMRREWEEILGIDD